MEKSNIEYEELEILVNDLLEKYGLDFSGYSRASLKRRVNHLFSLDGFLSFAEFRYRLISNQDYLPRFIEKITVTVTEMFRDPVFFKVLREQVLPALGTYPHIRIWHAGCSSGEEVYSMAILLKEANLYEKSLIYATDINPAVIEKAKSGIFPIAYMRQYSENYILSGGKEEFSKYYTAGYDVARFDPELRRKIIFSIHNLVSDHSFNEFQLILCRNVLIYFDTELQNRVFKLFDESLDNLGYLGLGDKETIRFSNFSTTYKRISSTEKVWRKYSN